MSRKGGEAKRIRIGDLDVRHKLITIAKAHGVITYKQLARFVFGESMNVWDPARVGTIAGDISDIESDAGRPILSAIVVLEKSLTKDLPYGHPGGGFFGHRHLPADCRRSKEHYRDELTLRDIERAQAEQVKVWTYWRTHEDKYDP